MGKVAELVEKALHLHSMRSSSAAGSVGLDSREALDFLVMPGHLSLVKCEMGWTGDVLRPVSRIDGV